MICSSMLSIAVAAVAVCATASPWLAPRGFTPLDEVAARAVVGGACMNPLGVLECGKNKPEGSVCIYKLGKRFGTSAGIVNEAQTLCYDAANPPQTEWDVANCTHTHKKCLQNEDFPPDPG